MDRNRGTIRERQVLTSELFSFSMGTEDWEKVTTVRVLRPYDHDTCIAKYSVMTNIGTCV